MGGLINAIEISSQGLSTQRAKMNVIAENMANAETVETDEGGPYRRRRVVVSEDKKAVSFNKLLSQANTRLARTNAAHRPARAAVTGEKETVSSVSYEEVTDPDSSFRLVYDPGHPNADEDGYVCMPDIDVITEMVDMMTATRAYEANTSVISASKQMAQDALDI